jgi:hypothetical protein
MGREERGRGGGAERAVRPARDADPREKAQVRRGIVDEEIAAVDHERRIGDRRAEVTVRPRAQRAIRGDLDSQDEPANAATVDGAPGCTTREARALLPVRLQGEGATRDALVKARGVVGRPDEHHAGAGIERSDDLVRGERRAGAFQRCAWTRRVVEPGDERIAGVGAGGVARSVGSGSIGDGVTDRRIASCIGRAVECRVDRAPCIDDGRFGDGIPDVGTAAVLGFARVVPGLGAVRSLRVVHRLCDIRCGAAEIRRRVGDGVGGALRIAAVDCRERKRAENGQ